MQCCISLAYSHFCIVPNIFSSVLHIITFMVKSCEIVPLSLSLTGEFEYSEPKLAFGSLQRHCWYCISYLMNLYWHLGLTLTLLSESWLGSLRVGAPLSYQLPAEIIWSFPVISLYHAALWFLKNSNNKNKIINAK